MLGIFSLVVAFVLLFDAPAAELDAELEASFENKGVCPDRIWCTGSAACSNNGRSIGPSELKEKYKYCKKRSKKLLRLKTPINYVFKISLGKSMMCCGIGLPTSTIESSLLKLLQLCSRRLYVPTLFFFYI